MNKKRPTNMVHHGMRFPAHLLDELRKLAHQHERSLNAEFIWALRFYVEEMNKTRLEEKQS